MLQDELSHLTSRLSRMTFRRILAFVFGLTLAAVCCLPGVKWRLLHLGGFLSPDDAQSEDLLEVKDPYAKRLVEAARLRLKSKVRYIPSYVRIAYPNGDVPPDTGVCSDEIVRIYRVLGIDLQQLVHEDMGKNFKSYPQQWGLSAPDSNIDHRRVPNLIRYLKGQGALLKVTEIEEEYRPGDLVAWDLGGGITHIGIVMDTKVPGANRPFILHNIGRGPELEDFLFQAKIIAHARYQPKI